MSTTQVMIKKLIKVIEETKTQLEKEMEENEKALNKREVSTSGDSMQNTKDFMSVIANSSFVAGHTAANIGLLGALLVLLKRGLE